MGYSSWGRKESDRTEQLHFTYRNWKLRIRETSLKSHGWFTRYCVSCCQEEGTDQKKISDLLKGAKLVNRDGNWNLIEMRAI